MDTALPSFSNTNDKGSYSVSSVAGTVWCLPVSTTPLGHNDHELGNAGEQSLKPGSQAPELLRDKTLHHKVPGSRQALL